MVLRFTGAQVALYGLRAHDHGHADVIVDGECYRDVKWYELADAPHAHVFTSRLLRPGTHTLEIVAKDDGPIALECVRVLRWGRAGGPLPCGPA